MANMAARIIAYTKHRLRRWSRRYLRDPISLTDDAGKLKNIVSHNSRRVRWSAWAIVGGLFTEVLVLLWFSAAKSAFETGLLIISNFIIAAGVFGEDHFAHKSGEAATRLQQISDEKVATAEARAAEADQKAQEAILELARLKARRDLTQKQRGRVVDKLKKFSGTEYDISINSIDPEILNFVFIVELILSTAGWTELGWQGPLGVQVLTREGQPSIAISASVTHVMIGVHVHPTS